VVEGPAPGGATINRSGPRRPTEGIPEHVSSKPSKELETFPNPEPGRDYEIRFTCPEFTCLCPRTGQPDFATFTIDYVPDRLCVELKSLKLYLWSFRDEGHFHEAVTNRILNDLVEALAPRRMRVVGDFKIRGGIHTMVTAEHGRPEPR
jgi:7-cyano-7-deazaguanine reductase